MLGWYGDDVELTKSRRVEEIGRRGLRTTIHALTVDTVFEIGQLRNMQHLANSVSATSHKQHHRKGVLGQVVITTKGKATTCKSENNEMHLKSPNPRRSLTSRRTSSGACLQGLFEIGDEENTLVVPRHPITMHRVSKSFRFLCRSPLK